MIMRKESHEQQRGWGSVAERSQGGAEGSKGEIFEQPLITDR